MSHSSRDERAAGFTMISPDRFNKGGIGWSLLKIEDHVLTSKPDNWKI
jgi:hypothetical protein